MKITLSWITRKRTSQLSFSIASFVTNADNNNDIEYLFAIDDDDTDTENTINQLNPFVKRCGSELKVMKTKRHGYDYLNEYDNEICKIFTGHCIIFVTDDMFCLTKGWDTRIREELKNYLDEPVLIHTQPWEDRQKFWPTMPGITRKWYEVTEHVAGWTSADLYLHWLAEDAGLRVVNLIMKFISYQGYMRVKEKIGQRLMKHMKRVEEELLLEKNIDIHEKMMKVIQEMIIVVNTMKIYKN